MAEDGVLGKATLARIDSYQRRELHFRQPDGRIDPGGRTMASLIHRVALHRGKPSGSPALAPHHPVATAAVAALPEASKVPAKQQAVATPGAAGAKLTDADFAAAAAKLGTGIEPALIHAIATVESGGKSGFGPAGLPVIAYEGHIFRRSTHSAYDTSHPLLSYPYRQKAGPEWQKNNKDQATAWATLTEATALDHDAALMACSWGMFQVMGFNFKVCGYATVDDFVAAMKAGERGQLDACVGYCRSRPGMVAALQRKDYAAIAAAYNGNDYGDYDKRIQRAYLKYKG